ncbi:MAG: tRNA modification GTPase [Cyclobacteriaceae bacterium]|nr:tRNA modification GTPase [Cyclobacteriaceae bacterium]
MKIKLLSILLILLSLNTFSQISFQKGYYIDNNYKKTECLIKNVDWKDNPSEFTYKLENSSIPQKGDIASVKEFGVYGFSKYIRENVKIDHSSNDYKALTDDKNPIWKQEVLFLKVIIEGKSSLYYYENRDLKRFFYSVSDTSVNQLIYKRYLVNNSTIASNNRFRQQLAIDVMCTNTSMNSLKKVTYNLKVLEKHFINHNRCIGDTTMVNFNRSKNDLLNLKITSGINMTSMLIDNHYYDDVYFNTIDFPFKENINLRFGLEFEFIMPFHKNKWGITIEPAYQQLNTEKEFTSPIYGTRTASIEFRSIEFPIGLRHYIFLSDKSKIFLNGIYIPSVPFEFDSKINVGNVAVLDVFGTDSFAFGGGFDQERLSVEVRYYLKRNLLNLYSDWSTDYRRLSFIIGYKIKK